MKKKLKIIISIINIILITVVITGCWDNRDLTEMGIAVAIGFDKTSNGNVEFTVQLIKPGIIRARARGNEQKAYWSHSVTGETVFAAARNLLITVNRKVFLSHIQLMVIGEDIARDGFRDVLDLFERDAETSRLADVVISRGISAKEVLKARSELEDIPAVHITDVLKNNRALAKIKKIILIDLLKCLSCPGYSPPIGVIQRASGQKTEENQDQNQEKTDDNLQIKDLEIEGAAVFKEDKLIGWLDPIATRGLLFAQNEVKSGIINTANPLEKDKNVAFEIVRSSGKLDVKFKNGEPELIIEVKTEGRMGDQQGKGDLTTPAMIKKLEKEVGKIIEEDIYRALSLSQSRFKSDFFGFAGIVRKKNPVYWKMVEKNWDQIFSQAAVKLKVTWKTRSTANITKPTQPK